MRRFSQRQHLVTLSDINVTPLLDLAFVLLIIFIITTPLLEQGITLNLPDGGKEDAADLKLENIWAVDIDTNGVCHVKNRAWNMDELYRTLYYVNLTNKNLTVYVRADEVTSWRWVAAFLHRMELAGIDQVSMRTEPPR